MNLPASTVVNRAIPKEKFYTKTSVSTKLRQQFTDEIEKIRWTHKISPDTLNIDSKDYSELQVFEITLKRTEISSVVLKHIDTFIPYPILFIIKKHGAEQAVISFKESTAKSEHQMKVEEYYETPWTTEVNLELKGRSVDEIYKNLLFQVAPELGVTNRTDMKMAVEEVSRQQKIQKQIDTLNKRIANEISLAKKQELARERYILESLI